MLFASKRFRKSIGMVCTGSGQYNVRKASSHVALQSTRSVACDESWSRRVESVCRATFIDFLKGYSCMEWSQGVMWCVMPKGMWTSRSCTTCVCTCTVTVTVTGNRTFIQVPLGMYRIYTDGKYSTSTRLCVHVKNVLVPHIMFSITYMLPLYSGTGTFMYVHIHEDFTCPTTHT